MYGTRLLVSHEGVYSTLEGAHPACLLAVPMADDVVGVLMVLGSGQNSLASILPVLHDGSLSPLNFDPSRIFFLLPGLGEKWNGTQSYETVWQGCITVRFVGEVYLEKLHS